MGKLTDMDLATLVSRRIMELLDLTGLSLQGLANFTGISYSTLRSACKKSRSLSLDSFSRICKSFQIDIADFFNAKRILSIDHKILAELMRFKVVLRESPDKQQVQYVNLIQPEKINTERKQERAFLADLIYNSDYFLTARTIDQMVADFKKNYKTHIKAERLSVLLKKYIGLELLDKKVLPKTKRKPSDSRRPYLYYKNVSLTKIER
ncbi:helix-turn-helix transcriptional regulator [Sphingobacterium sp.]|uniref:helix-turn-helix domain-containing protein n=1 Tax=Sphingobacterium sp. TaxID=341027 RepID=UPI0028A2B924|nr:helix-turn-helix transcriptional regulator [Sphingobacterium sp.]